VDALKEKVARLPRKPGVYLLKGADGEILYVGKAADLRSRVRSYLQDGAALPHKTAVLMGHASDLDYLVTDNEVEALLLESNLIKEHDPRFNIVLRDDKSYPYIKVTLQEDFPRVYVTRRVVEDGARYFGPYAHVKLLRRNLSLIKDLFPVRSCRYDLLREAPRRACLDYHIRRCEAPCVGYVSQAEYRAMIDDVVRFLEGDTRAATRMLERRMEGAAGRLQFERAAQYKRQIDQLEEIRDGQRMTSLAGDDRDVVAMARLGEEACGIVLRIREGRLLGKEHHVLGNVEGSSDGEILSLFLTRYYLRSETFPPELLLPFDFDDRYLIEEALLQEAGRAVRLHVPQRGDKARQVRLAERNALYQLEERRLRAEDQTQRASDAIVELKESLGLARLPRRIACVDISTIHGEDSVGSVVTFANGAPRKAGYRHFRIKYAEGQNDFAMMAAVVQGPPRPWRAVAGSAGDRRWKRPARGGAAGPRRAGRTRGGRHDRARQARGGDLPVRPAGADLARAPVEGAPGGPACAERGAPVRGLVPPETPRQAGGGIGARLGAGDRAQAKGRAPPSLPLGRADPGDLDR
jgi:excinuclease ABC subunit C